MAGVRWAAVVLTVFLSAGGSRAAVDQNWLTGIVEGLKKEYALGDAFSLAVNVPEEQDINTLPEVLQEDPADKVKQTLSEGQVYQGVRVVAAAQPEAVARVLQSMQTLVNGSAGNFLVIYSEEAPCCPADPNDVADKINDVVQKWSGYALVFSKVADGSQLAESFKQIAASKLGLDHIFRCYKPGDDAFRCTGCSSGEGGVAPSCVATDAPSITEQGGGDAAGTGEETAQGGGGGQAIATGIDELTGGGRGKGGGKAGKESKRRGSKGGKVRKQSKRRGSKGGKVRKQSKRRGSKGGKVRKQSKRRGSKGGKVRKQSKRRGSKGGKVRKQSKRRGRKGGKVRKQSKRRGSKGGKVRKQSKRRGSKGGKVRKQSKRRGSGKGKKRGKGGRRRGLII
ncbi:oleosin GRP-17-like [Cyclopterus lumpus]|uniref:oleosin GRP-17-like n=1 Tax=Cyclopterus lumpus TaxID=8103 RepID=UPI001486240F|nr:oleosin GRP-17-like [Cyclopterus lumpus]